MTRDGTLVLVRHGRTTWVEQGRFQGRGDPPLSDHGERQAAAVAARLADPVARPPLPLPPGAPRVIRHSPLARAAGTATAIATAMGGVELRPDPDLVELDQGAWEGLTHLEVSARWPDALAAWRQDPVQHHAPDGEALQHGAGRAAAALGRALQDLGLTIEDARHPDGARSAVLGYDGSAAGPDDPPVPVPAAEPWSLLVAHDGILRLCLLRLLDLPLAAYWAFPFGLCCVTVIELRAGRARLRAHNLDGHLATVEDRPGHDPRSRTTGTT